MSNKSTQTMMDDHFSTTDELLQLATGLQKQNEELKELTQEKINEAVKSDEGVIKLYTDIATLMKEIEELKSLRVDDKIYNEKIIKELNDMVTDRVHPEDIAHLFSEATAEDGWMDDFDWEDAIGGLQIDNKQLKKEKDKMFNRLWAQKGRIEELEDEKDKIPMYGAMTVHMALTDYEKVKKENEKLKENEVCYQDQMERMKDAMEDVLGGVDQLREWVD
jgi:N-acetylglutamate synthase-like GNAT family acetyltransferase